MSLDSQILSALRAAGSGAVSGAELSQNLGVSRTAVWARIEALRELGYDIQASPHAGYTLRASPEVLHAEDLLARLGSVKVVGRDIQVFQETTSTNDVLEKLARDGVREGAVVFAESQTRGRGRLGRKWVSPPGKGLWFSLLLRPQIRPQETTRLTIASATAVRRAIAAVTALKPEIKWPNDILCGGKKVAGVLTELNAELDRVHYVIVGIGLNVNAAASEFPPELRTTATSLKAELGRAINRAELAVAILREMDTDYDRLGKGEFNTIAAEWADFCTTLGQQVSIRTGQRVVRGRAEALGEDGALLVRTEHGHLEPVIGGDVTLDKQH